MKEVTGKSGKANGLGENKVAAWKPTSVGGYSRGLKAPKTGTIPGEFRKGPGQK
jgi:hypothetical protein